MDAEPERANAEALIRVALVEDAAYFRDGVELHLSREPDIRLVASVASVEDLDVALAANGEQVDVAVVDLMLDGAACQGTDAVRHVAAIAGTVIVMSSSSDIAAACDALRAGAADYLLKDNDTSALIRAIKAAAAGCLTLSPWASNILTQWPGFTPREREILEIQASGASAYGIGRKLEISEATVVKHQKSMRVKIGAANGNELIAWAVREGFARVRRR